MEVQDMIIDLLSHNPFFDKRKAEVNVAKISEEVLLVLYKERDFVWNITEQMLYIIPHDMYKVRF